MDKREFDIFELIKIVLLNLKGILIFVVIVAIGAVTYSLLAPKIWKSEASFYAVGSSGGLLSGLSGLGSIASGLMGVQEDVDVLNFVTVMESRTFSESVIQKFDLINYFELKEKEPLENMDVALRLLRKIVKINLSEKTNLVTVSVETMSKTLSRDMVSFYISNLDSYNRNLKLTKGKRNRIFLAERVADLRTNIDSLLIANRDFQLKNKTIDIEGQSAALISSYSDVVAEKMKADIALELARDNYLSGSPQIKQLIEKRDALIKQIKSLESDKSGLKPQYLIDIANIPDLAVKAAQIRINLEIAQKVMEFIYPQYEAAKLEELKDMPTIDIVDSPREAGVRIRPKRAMICLIATFLAFCLGVLGAIIKDIVSQRSERIEVLKDIIFKKK